MRPPPPPSPSPSPPPPLPAPARTRKRNTKGFERKESGSKEPDPKDGRDHGKTPREDFSHSTRIWKTAAGALRGIDQGQIDKYKAGKKPCWLCGHDNHMTFHRRRLKDIDVNSLPPPPTESTSGTSGKKAVAGAKRKQTPAAAEPGSDDNPCQEAETRVIGGW